jgi:hypothetical protein
VSSITIISDAPSCGVVLMTIGIIYDRNMFRTQATVCALK